MMRDELKIIDSKTLRSTALSLIAAAVLTACVSTPVAEKPVLDLPQATSGPVAEDLGRWWLRYNDPALTALIERALTYNTDLKVTEARVAESAALLSVARSDLYPSLDAGFNASRSKATEAGVIPRPAGTYTSNNYQAGITIAYELDLWGRVRNANKAAMANLIASREAMAGFRSSLAAQVARGYFTLLATDRKLELTRQTLATREDAFQLAQKRLAGGTANNLVVQQAQSERDAIAASLPRLIAAQAQSERALALLAGDSPRAIVENRITRSKAEVLPPAPNVPEGLPSDMLARRPDIREAEANLAATQARVGQARAMYFPQIILTGSGGQESASLSDLFSGPALVWRLAASITQPIFGLAQIDAGVKAAEAREEAAKALYVKSVQTAFTEVYDAIGNMRAASDTLVAQERRSGALRTSLRVAQLRYDAGVSGYLELLDAERNLYSVDADRIDAQAFRLNASVDLFRALGGGWETAQITEQASAGTKGGK
ncbi:efflux transporter outer membrane subunit [Uliginosibacterium sp. H3]|uniref:Efflux transporter outer membrane subunit n=1 Tax=Uliginosibacterium silvisoli TaxID=3114758 RepID=A0ABU6K681_9RHOO|nr:efflux transporter outer membrane subunit [Uliginosibacterium sp. H3]